jgi:hypothetical protein
MHNGHNPKLRFGVSLQETRTTSFQPAVANTPALPSLNFGLVGQQAPGLLYAPAGILPKASAVVITWANAEWAALHHVFCAGETAMPYSNRSKDMWPDWQKYSANLPSGGPPDWTFWGYYRLVQVSGNPVLLFKSNTHLDWPGPTYLETMIKMLAAEVTPNLILSVGTAGGAKPQDHIGTVRIVSAGTLFESGQPSASWPEYENGWTAGQSVLGNANFKQLLFPVPTTGSDLAALCSQFDHHYRASLTMADLDPNGLNLGDPTPQIVDQSGGSSSLLTTPTFVVGTTDGNYEAFTSIEMDDAIIGEACKGSGVAFGFVRNISDPVQNSALPAKTQGNWGSTVYDAYGFYTSYNGAVAAWATLSG